MTGATPSPVDRKLYGDLADDIALLRSDGRIVARYKDGFRVDSAPEIFTAAQVRGMAAKVRNRRLAAKTALIHTTAGHEITKTREGTPAGDGAGTPVESWAGSAIAKPTCTKCGGPMSKWSKGQCATCYAQAGRGSYPQGPYAERPDKFWRAVGPSESTKLQGPMPNAGDGGETAATRCRPSPFNPDAAPSGRADVGLDSDVPPAATPQTASGPGRSAVTPAPESGARAGTIPAGDTGNAGGSHDTLTPAPEVARPATPAASCPCGRPRGHGGRCWYKRREQGPRVCEKCGGPRSRRSTRFCRDCYSPAVTSAQVASPSHHDRQPSDHIGVTSKMVEGRVNALEHEVAALKLANQTLKVTNAQLEKAVGEMRALLSAEGLR